jgi:hypothetical protein
MSSDTIWELRPTKTEAARAIPPNGVHTLTTSTRFRNDELSASGKSLELDTRPYRRRGYFVRSPRRVLERLKTAAIKAATKRRFWPSQEAPRQGILARARHALAEVAAAGGATLRMLRSRRLSANLTLMLRPSGGRGACACRREGMPRRARTDENAENTKRPVAPRRVPHARRKSARDRPGMSAHEP